MSEEVFAHEVWDCPDLNRQTMRAMPIVLDCVSAVLDAGAVPNRAKRACAAIFVGNLCKNIVNVSRPHMKFAHGLAAPVLVP